MSVDSTLWSARVLHTLIASHAQNVNAHGLSLTSVRLSGSVTPTLLMHAAHMYAINCTLHTCMQETARCTR